MTITKFISLIIISVFLLSNCKTIKNSVDNAETAKIKYYKDSINTALETFSKRSLIPGFSVAIVDEKRLLYSRGFGYSDIKNKIAFDDQTINWVASISKTLVGLSIMKLVEQKKLELDDPINSILPYKIINPYFPNKQITVRHLVTHTSTLTDFFEPYTVGEADICLEKEGNYNDLPAYLQPNITWFRLGKKISLDENIRKFTQPKEKWYSDSSFLKKEPGSYFQYTNLGASIAARIVELRSNMSFIDFTKKYIFDPLKMSNTAWNFQDLDPKLISKIYAPNDENNPTAVVEHPQYYMTNYPVSGLKTNANDLAKYLIEMINGFDGKGKLLNNDSYKRLFTPQLSSVFKQ
jgi:CubicO group peptidase (beta-lactamase class C family)